MSVYLVCPLCGKLAHLNCFNPDDYDDDIKCVEMRSLGRAKGFEVTKRFSALGDEELMNMISSRCYAILKIVGEEVTETFMVTDVENRLRDKIVELQSSLDSYEEEMDGILAKVNDVLIDIYEEEFVNLEKAMDALITEYQEVMEEAEDEDEEAEDDDEVEYAEAFESRSELDREILLAERAEAKTENNGDF